MAKMRAVYLTYALLAVIIGAVANIDAAVTKREDKSATQQTAVLISQLNDTANKDAQNDSTTPFPVVTKPDQPSTITTSAPANGTNTSTAATVPTTPAGVTTTLKSTTAEPTKPTNPTVKPITTPATPTSSTTEKPAPPTKSTTPADASTTTTAVPPMDVPTAAPNSNERHFDGLSFIGGIILATCLMAIGAFSWKFYRTCNEQNYRTL